MVGLTADETEVVINLPPGTIGHIIFSPDQARQLSSTLLRKANEANWMARLDEHGII